MRNRLIILFLIVVGELAISTVIAAQRSAAPGGVQRGAVPPANDTDPASHCNPEGLTRALIYPDPIEFIELPDRILQHFQWRYYIRTIWLDGRPPLKDPDQLRWWGYSTGHWEGDTLV